MAACGRLLMSAPTPLPSAFPFWEHLLPIMHTLLTIGQTSASDLVALAGCLASGMLPLLRQLALSHGSSIESQPAGRMHVIEVGTCRTGSRTRRAFSLPIYTVKTTLQDCICHLH